MDYIKGLFVKEKEGKYGKYLIISATQEGIDNIASLSKNQDGFRTLIATPRKDDPKKFSIKPFVAREKEDSPF
jgi:hypothetical protein